MLRPIATPGRPGGWAAAARIASASAASGLAIPRSPQARRFRARPSVRSDSKSWHGIPPYLAPLAGSPRPNPTAGRSLGHAPPPWKTGRPAAKPAGRASLSTLSGTPYLADERSAYAEQAAVPAPWRAQPAVRAAPVRAVSSDSSLNQRRSRVRATSFEILNRQRNHHNQLLLKS
jgi:hypothetical protein